MNHDTDTTTTTTISRRQALQRGAAAGAIVWGVPMVVSQRVQATGGSNGAQLDGPLDSITCVWNQRFFRPARGTGGKPQNDLSKDTFCEINVGDGFKVLAFGDSFTVRRGQVIRFRAFGTGGGGRQAEPTADAEVQPTTTEAPATTQPPTTQPPTTAPVVQPSTTAPPQPEPVVEPAPVVDEAVPVTTESVPPAPEVPAPTTTQAPEPEAPDATTTTTEPPADLPGSDGPAPVDAIVIDLSGRTDVNIGDVFGYFQVVDAEPA